MDEQVQMLCEKIDNRTESIERHQAKIEGDQRNEYLCRMWKTGSKRDGILSVLRSEKRKKTFGMKRRMCSGKRPIRRLNL